MSGRGDEPANAFDEATARALLTDDRSHDGPLWLRRLLGVAALVGAALLSVFLLQAPERAAILPGLVAGQLESSGVDNPVNAVLLNFRAWDTLLEMTVVLATVVAVWSLDRAESPGARDPGDRSPDPVLHELARLVAPLAAAVAVYLVWAGSYGPGGGFQAGTLVAGASVLLAAAGYIPAFSAVSPAVRIGAAAGVLVFLVVGAGSLAATGSFLDYPPGLAHDAIVLTESVLAAAVAVALVELFVDVPAVPDPDPSLEPVDPTGDPLGRLLTRARRGSETG